MVDNFSSFPAGTIMQNKEDRLANRLGRFVGRLLRRTEACDGTFTNVHAALSTTNLADFGQEIKNIITALSSDCHAKRWPARMINNVDRILSRANTVKITNQLRG